MPDGSGHRQIQQPGTRRRCSAPSPPAASDSIHRIRYGRHPGGVGAETRLLPRTSYAAVADTAPPRRLSTAIDRESRNGFPIDRVSGGYKLYIRQVNCRARRPPHARRHVRQRRFPRHPDRAGAGLPRPVLHGQRVALGRAHSRTHAYGAAPARRGDQRARPRQGVRCPASGTRRARCPESGAAGRPGLEPAARALRTERPPRRPRAGDQPRCACEGRTRGGDGLGHRCGRRTPARRRDRSPS